VSVGFTGCSKTKAVSYDRGEKPDQITVMADDTMITEAQGAQEFYDYYKELTGLEINWIRPEKSVYYDQLASAFEKNENIPDVVLLFYNKYKEYAAAGYLWDMTDAWDKSETKNSRRLRSYSDDILKNLYVQGKDAQSKLYGFTPSRASGRTTYVKKSWMDAAGISKLPETWNEYYDMLLKMHAAKNKSVLCAAGYMDSDKPYVSSLKEFYQDAQFDFYKDQTGKWVDGFSEPAMKNAIARITKAVQDGIIDKETSVNVENEALNKFITDNTGVFTSWGGSNAISIQSSVKSRNSSDEVYEIQLKDADYIHQTPSVWCITSAAKNPNQIFSWFIDTMLDGESIQEAWTYGKTDGSNVSDKKIYIENDMNLANYKGSYGRKCLNFYSDEQGEYAGEIWMQRKQVLVKIITGEFTLEQGYEYYNNNAGKQVKMVLDSLNNLK
jgi:ABC-type glycerol-3-phosphate transport system substrate-binding protein